MTRHFFLLLITVLSCAYTLHASDLKVIDPDELREACLQIEEDPYFRTIRNILSQNPVDQVAKNWDSVIGAEFSFSHEVEPSFTATSQNMTGRCWLFAGLNVLRTYLGQKRSVSDFEFSQSYLFFYDKIEKSNFFLERIIETHQEPLDSDVVRQLLYCTTPDGGDWHNLVNLIDKYGLVPKSVYPENEACYYSAAFNDILRKKLLRDAEILRDLLNTGSSAEIVREEKQKMLSEVYQILVLHMGTPPTEFDCAYYDKDKEFHLYKNVTPYTFAEECIDESLNEYITLVHSPRLETPYYTKYRVPLSSRMVGGEDHISLNLPMDELKEIAKTMLIEGHPVYFTVDMSSQADSSSGILDSKLYEFDSLYRLNFSMEKGSRMRYRASVPNHAMVLMGVHVENGVSIRWKVENSWSADRGKKGFFMMTDDWFDEYVFQIVIPRKYLPENLEAVLETTPVSLHPQDPLWLSY